MYTYTCTLTYICVIINFSKMSRPVATTSSWSRRRRRPSPLAMPPQTTPPGWRPTRRRSGAPSVTLGYVPINLINWLSRIYCFFFFFLFIKRPTHYIRMYDCYCLQLSSQLTTISTVIQSITIVMTMILIKLLWFNVACFILLLLLWYILTLHHRQNSGWVNA